MRTKTTKPPADDVSDPTLIGYARVSTIEQNLDMQIAALTRAGVHPDHIHVEQVSGVSSKRPGRDLALKDARPGDTFVVWKLDRVGRSLLDLYTFVMDLDREGIAFRSLTESIDTKTPIGKFSLAVLAAAAQFERDQIQERTREGVRRAKECGKVFGQPPKVTDANRMEIEQAIHAGERIADIAERHGMSEGCLRTWYPRAILEQIRRSGPLKVRPKQQRKQ